MASSPRAPAATLRIGSVAGGALAFQIAALLALSLSGCAAPQMALLKSGLDSLRTQIDTLAVRDSLALHALDETRRELASQRDILLSTRATSGSTTQELFEQMGRLEGKLDEVMGRFHQITERAAPPQSPGGPDPNQLYDQAAQDLTQGRYAMALQGFRDFVMRFPSSDLADNAQYGVGECFFAQSMFDSAAVEYSRVPGAYPDADRVPAALYKLSLSQDKVNRPADAKKTLQDLVKRFPLSGEAQLARERLGTSRRN
jgi:tol-pal system protein YbgF